MIRYGFACKTVGIPKIEQKALTLAKATEENLLAVSRSNLLALTSMISYCQKQKIFLLRISSDIIPLGSHPAISFDWRNLLAPELSALALHLEESGVRVSMHPGQYTILNSPRQEVVERARDDLMFHTDFLDVIKANTTCKIVLHLGGGYGNKPVAIEQFIRVLPTLSQSILDRLVLENDERIFTIEEVLSVCEKYSLPAIFDVFHHALNPPVSGTLAYWLDRSAKTWREKDGRQKIHYSQQMEGGKSGSHSKTIEIEAFLNFHAELGARELDVMLEVKDKNISAVKCLNLSSQSCKRSALTEEWARYKYLILEYSPIAYQAIRELLKAEKPSSKEFYMLIETALKQGIEIGHARNAAQHVWGYINDLATPVEKKRILFLMDKLEDISSLASLKRAMHKIIERNSVRYLQESLYFYL